MSSDAAYTAVQAAPEVQAKRLSFFERSVRLQVPAAVVERWG